MEKEQVDMQLNEREKVLQRQCWRAAVLMRLEEYGGDPDKVSVEKYLDKHFGETNER